MTKIGFGVLCILSLSLAGWGEEVSPSSGRKSTFRVYDQRPIYVPGAWENPGETSRNSEAEFLPGVDRGTIQSEQRQFGGGMLAPNPLVMLPQPAVPQATEEKEKSSSWLKPGTFLLETDLIRSDDPEDSGGQSGGSEEDSPAGWSTLQESLIDAELQTPEEKETAEAKPTPEAPVTPNVASGAGLTLAPVVSEVTPGAARPAASVETDSGLPPNRVSERAAVPTGMLPSVLRMDNVQTVAVPQMDNTQPLERSRGEFQAVGERWQSTASPDGIREGPSRGPMFGAAMDRSPPIAGGGRNLFSPPVALPSVSAPNPLPASVSPPLYSPPPVAVPPALVLDREHFRPDEYRIRPRTGSFP